MLNTSTTCRVIFWHDCTLETHTGGQVLGCQCIIRAGKTACGTHFFTKVTHDVWSRLILVSTYIKGGAVFVFPVPLCFYVLTTTVWFKHFIKCIYWTSLIPRLLSHHTATRLSLSQLDADYSSTVFCISIQFYSYGIIACVLHNSYWNMLDCNQFYTSIILGQILNLERRQG